jgi:hypothetical protein
MVTRPPIPPGTLSTTKGAVIQLLPTVEEAEVVLADMVEAPGGIQGTTAEVFHMAEVVVTLTHAGERQ